MGPFFFIITHGKQRKDWPRFFQNVYRYLCIDVFGELFPFLIQLIIDGVRKKAEKGIRQGICIPRKIVLPPVKKRKSS